MYRAIVSGRKDAIKEQSSKIADYFLLLEKNTLPFCFCKLHCPVFTAHSCLFEKHFCATVHNVL